MERDMADKWLYALDEIEEAEQLVGGDWDEVRALLGGKGANLAEMTSIGLPVPPGFTITTAVCDQYYKQGRKLPSGLMAEVKKNVGTLEKELRKKFGTLTFIR